MSMTSHDVADALLENITREGGFGDGQTLSDIGIDTDDLPDIVHIMELVGVDLQNQKGELLMMHVSTFRAIVDEQLRTSPEEAIEEIEGFFE